MYVEGGRRECLPLTKADSAEDLAARCGTALETSCRTENRKPQKIKKHANGKQNTAIRWPFLVHWTHEERQLGCPMCVMWVVNVNTHFAMSDMTVGLLLSARSAGKTDQRTLFIVKYVKVRF